MTIYPASVPTSSGYGLYLPDRQGTGWSFKYLPLSTPNPSFESFSAAVNSAKPQMDTSGFDRMVSQIAALRRKYPNAKVPLTIDGKVVGHVNPPAGEVVMTRDHWQEFRRRLSEQGFVSSDIQPGGAGIYPYVIRAVMHDVNREFPADFLRGELKKMLAKNELSTGRL